MLKIEFDRSNIPESVARQLDGYRSQIQFATSLAVNRTAELVRRAIVNEMQKVFDRPTAFTRNSLYVTPSTKDKLEAVVWLKDEYSVGNQGTPATKYLGPEIFGGSRHAKSHEKRLRDKGMLGTAMFAVPAQGAEGLLNRYGNMNGGLIKQMMSSLQINRDIGYQSNETVKSRKRKSKRSRYFVIGGDTPLGIGSRSTGGSLQPVLWFVRAPNYKPRLDFFGIGQKVIDEHLDKELVKAMQYAIRTARQQ